jgi:hypothetical protein
MRSSSSGRGSAPATSQPACLYYARLPASPRNDSRIAALHTWPEQTTGTAGTTLEPEVTLTLTVAWQRTAREHFRQVPPTVRELDAAIGAVEDAITPALPLIDSGDALATRNAIVREIALAAGLRVVPDPVLRRDAVERTFSRLAAVAHGSSASIHGVPGGADLAAALLILRKPMHHARRPATAITLDG